jgi:hypothetical protein
VVHTRGSSSGLPHETLTRTERMAAKKKTKKKAKKASAQYPIKNVHFSNIIIQ